MVEFGYEQLVEATQSFSPSRLIGKGSHGAVFRGILRENQVVAVKRSSINGVEAQRENLKKLDNEISMLSSLRESSNVIGYLGASHGSAENDDKLLVMEFMPNGSLHDLLHAAVTPPSWPKRVEIAMQIARAVQFLHEGKPSVIHRDIKSDNILFDSNWTAKLADFGLAISPADLSSQAAQPAGTIGYLDPSYTSPNELSTKNDVFSLGVVLLEIISCRKIIDLTKASASIVEWAVPLVKKQRTIEIYDPRIPFPTCMMESMIRRILNVASRCLSEDHDRRPPIGEIVVAMESCSVERVRLGNMPAWTGVLNYLVQLKRRQKLSRKCSRVVYSTQQGDVNNGDVNPTGKLVLLKDILAGTGRC
ncbi:Zinc finger family protein isoform 1 [Hibiscus syriacus]|uniref:Zinc finger family protein isoform 1 n=1 Tax=Hibiscus syriacus TaxID=106335 RepID=A0A6A3CJB7_HIBSY|nr:serine/threonine-protein kinase-like protein At5g23170 [Hibiscus syriacus]KAE8727239.1 Zinc finger family protein isoform 1 [Hibiscus syriacus]